MTFQKLKVKARSARKWRGWDGVPEMPGSPALSIKCGTVCHLPHLQELTRGQINAQIPHMPKWKGAGKVKELLLCLLWEESSTILEHVWGDVTQDLWSSPATGEPLDARIARLRGSSQVTYLQAKTGSAHPVGQEHFTLCLLVCLYDGLLVKSTHTEHLPRAPTCQLLLVAQFLSILSNSSERYPRPGLFLISENHHNLSLLFPMSFIHSAPPANLVN